MSMASPIDPTMQGVVWTKTLQETVRDYPRLAGEETADLVIVGGGYSGLNAAIHAARNGLNVVVVEAGRVGNGAAGRNGGYNVPHFPGGMTPSVVEAAIGPRKGRALADLVLHGADAVFRQIEAFQIKCSAVQNGWMQPAHSDASMLKVRKVHDEWKALGAKVEWHSAADVADLLGARGYLGGWSNAEGGTVNPYSLAVGLARAAEQSGVRIFENSPVDGFEETGQGVVVRCGANRVSAKSAVFATNAYTGDFLPAIQKSVIPVYLYHVATKPLREELRGEILKSQLCFTDLRKSGGFGRLDADGRLISGGAVFDFGNKIAYGQDHARARMKLLFPRLTDRDIELESYWEGYCAVTESYLPHILRLGRNVFSVGGFSTRGVNLAQNLGRVMGEFVAGKRDLDSIPVNIYDQRHDVPLWSIKTRAARYVFPYYRLKDAMGLS
ncbi:MAG: NAD(P)/FAD-dependent oxidoreductase [Shinella sp.]|uniref:NAD(P)/FAD-dependent oxidoreductase n=1 Tax=Shinella sp. TaxID=1870904 RepID=UPI0040366DF7